MKQRRSPKWVLPESCCVVGAGGELVDRAACLQSSLDRPDPAIVHTQASNCPPLPFAIRPMPLLQTCYQTLKSDLLHVAYVAAVLGLSSSAFLVFSSAFPRFLLTFKGSVIAVDPRGPGGRPCSCPHSKVTHAGAVASICLTCPLSPKARQSAWVQRMEGHRPFHCIQTSLTYTE